MSRLRAKCPDCKTFTAVAIGPDYECHACGRVFHSGLVRVPQAWGDGGEVMVESAALDLPYPEIGVIEGAGFKHGRWLDTVLMQRALGAGKTTLPETR